jgi:hypothetical protein
MTTVPSKPTTEAGRRYLADPAGRSPLDAVLAIEAEARRNWHAEGYNEGKAEVRAYLLDDIAALERRNESLTNELIVARTDALDVAALGEAMFRVGISRWKDDRSQPLPWAVEHQQDWAKWLGQAQDAILAEYRAILARRQP